MIRRPKRWVGIAQLLAEQGQMDVLAIADTLGLPRQPISNTCAAMARHGYLEQVGKTSRQSRKDRPTIAYIVTRSGRELNVPPPRDPRTGRDNWSLRPFGLGRCALADALGLARK